jgi:hypothetical protein
MTHFWHFFIKFDPHKWFLIYCYPWFRKIYHYPISFNYFIIINFTPIPFY